MKRQTSAHYRVSAVLFIAQLLASCPKALPAAESLPPASEVTRRLIERAQTVASAEQAPIYQYEKRYVLENLDPASQTPKPEEKLYRVTLVAAVPFNRLIKIQGRDLTAEELQEQDRKEERFRQKFLSADGKKLTPGKQGWITPELLDRYQFTVVERVLLTNRPTLVLTFKPKLERLPSKTVRDKLLNRLQGTVWIDEADADTARLSTGLTESFALGWLGMLGSLSQCELTLERQRMPGGAWVNTRQVLLLQCRKLATTMRFRVTEESSGFKEVGEGCRAGGLPGATSRTPNGNGDQKTGG